VTFYTKQHCRKLRQCKCDFREWLDGCNAETGSI
jgi:hypothetical protein